MIGIKIDEGKIGDIDLSGMKVVLAVKWPKAIHEGDGAAAIYIDESAPAKNRSAESQPS